MRQAGNIAVLAGQRQRPQARYPAVQALDDLPGDRMAGSHEDDPVEIGGGREQLRRCAGREGRPDLVQRSGLASEEVVEIHRATAV
jgi:hypothetical protein